MKESLGHSSSTRQCPAWCLSQSEACGINERRRNLGAETPLEKVLCDKGDEIRLSLWGGQISEESGRKNGQVIT